MKESNLNSLIVSNFKQAGGFSYKIIDPQFTNDENQRFNLKRPFDGFAVLDGFQYYYETKLLKGYQAFPFQKLSEHQITNLCCINKNSAFTTPMIIVGIYLYRVGVDLFFFRPNMKVWEMKCSIVKSQLEGLRERGLYLPLRKQTFDVFRIPVNIIEVRPYMLKGRPRVMITIEEEVNDYAEDLFED